MGKSKYRNRKSRLCTFKATSRGTVAHNDKGNAQSALRWPTRTDRPSPIIVGLAIQTHTHRLYACRVESPPPTGDRGHTEFQFFSQSLHAHHQQSASRRREDSPLSCFLLHLSCSPRHYHRPPPALRASRLAPEGHSAIPKTGPGVTCACACAGYSDSVR